MTDGIELAVIVGGASASAAFFIATIIGVSRAREEAAYEDRVAESLDAALEEISNTQLDWAAFPGPDNMVIGIDAIEEADRRRQQWPQPGNHGQEHFFDIFSPCCSYSVERVKELLGDKTFSPRRAQLLSDAFCFEFSPEGFYFWFDVLEELRYCQPLADDARAKLQSHLRIIHEVQEDHWRSHVAQLMSA